jgi:hypothetical protein
MKISPLVTVLEDEEEEVEVKRYDEEEHLHCVKAHPNSRHNVGTEKDDDDRDDDDDDNSTGMDSYVRNIHIDIDSTE